MFKKWISKKLKPWVHLGSHFFLEISLYPKPKNSILLCLFYCEINLGNESIWLPLKGYMFHFCYDIWWAALPNTSAANSNQTQRAKNQLKWNSTFRVASTGIGTVGNRRWNLQTYWFHGLSSLVNKLGMPSSFGMQISFLNKNKTILYCRNIINYKSSAKTSN